VDIDEAPDIQLLGVTLLNILDEARLAAALSLAATAESSPEGDF